MTGSVTPLWYGNHCQRAMPCMGILFALLYIGFLLRHGDWMSKWDVVKAGPSQRDLFVLNSRNLFAWWQHNDSAFTMENGYSKEGHWESESLPFGEKTLVIYSVHNDPSHDTTSYENLDFFLRVGVDQESERLVDYLFLVPSAIFHTFNLTSGRKGDDMPMFPSADHVRVIERPHDCLGTSGLRSLITDNDWKGGIKHGARISSIPLNMNALLSHYSHFILLDSTVRGPFLPRYVHQARSGGSRWDSPQAVKSWVSVLTDRVGPEVKLVGRSVSCEPELHVQAPVWATDRQGLRLLLKNGVLDCAMEEASARERHELGATRAVLNAGYHVDCLMLRYQGINLARLREYGLPCTGRDNPSSPLLNDGLPVNPLEVIFVLANRHFLASDALVRRYTDYFLGRVDLEDNQATTLRGQAALEARRQRLAGMVASCGATLDRKHLATRCPGCVSGKSLEVDQEIFIKNHVMKGYDFQFSVPTAIANHPPQAFCEAFARYQAPDLTP